MTEPSPTSTKRHQGLLFAGATAVISGFAVFVNGYGVKAWADISSPTTYTTLKNSFAALILVGVLVAATRRPSWKSWRPTGVGQWIGLIAVALFGGAIPFVLFFEGLARAESVQAAFIHKSLVIWVAVLAVVFLKERIGALQGAAIGLLIVGQVAVAGGVGGLEFGVGELMILVATLMWSVEVAVAKWLLAGAPSSMLAVVRMGGGAVALVTYGLASGGLTSISGVGWSHLGWIAVTAVFLAGYVGTWYAALSLAPAVDVTAILVGGAVITAMLRAAATGVPVSSPVGLVLVTAGVALVFMAANRRSNAIPAS